MTLGLNIAFGSKFSFFIPQPLGFVDLFHRASRSDKYTSRCLSADFCRLNITGPLIPSPPTTSLPRQRKCSHRSTRSRCSTEPRTGGVFPGPSVFCSMVLESRKFLTCACMNIGRKPPFGRFELSLQFFSSPLPGATQNVRPVVCVIVLWVEHHMLLFPIA